MRDQRVTTWLSKTQMFDKSVMQDMTEGETEAYTVMCFTPQERWLLLTLVSFYPFFNSRWSSDWTVDERDQLITNTLRRLICPMACEEDIVRIADAVEAIANAFITFNDKVDNTIVPSISQMDTTLEDRLTDINSTLQDIIAQMDTGVIPVEIIDQVELLLNGIGIILGAPSIPILPAP